VLVRFGSEGCLLVPRSSSTSVAMWTWPTWVVCWKPCSSCRSLHLLREEFLSAPIHSPLSGSPYRSFNWYQSRFRSLLTLTSLKSKDGVPGRKESDAR
jgi:hypothetical protein